MNHYRTTDIDPLLEVNYVISPVTIRLPASYQIRTGLATTYRSALRTCCVCAAVCSTTCVNITYKIIHRVNSVSTYFLQGSPPSLGLRSHFISWWMYLFMSPSICNHPCISEPFLLSVPSGFVSLVS